MAYILHYAGTLLGDYYLTGTSDQEEPTGAYQLNIYGTTLASYYGDTTPPEPEPVADYALNAYGQVLAAEFLVTAPPVSQYQLNAMGLVLGEYFLTGGEEEEPPPVEEDYALNAYGRELGEYFLTGGEGTPPEYAYALNAYGRELGDKFLNGSEPPPPAEVYELNAYGLLLGGFFYESQAPPTPTYQLNAYGQELGNRFNIPTYPEVYHYALTGNGAVLGQFLERGYGNLPGASPIALLDMQWVTRDNIAQTTFDYNCPAGVNRILVVAVHTQAGTGANPVVSSVTFGGMALTFGMAQMYTGVKKSRVELWYKTEPPTATGTVRVVLGDTVSECTIVCRTYSGVDRVSPVAATGGARVPADGPLAEWQVASSISGGLLVDAVTGMNQNHYLSPGENQDIEYRIRRNLMYIGGGSKEVTQPSTVRMAWWSQASDGIVTVSLLLMPGVLHQEFSQYRLYVDWEGDELFRSTVGDMSGYVREVPRIRRGRDSELSRMEAGTMEIMLVNKDKRFTPTNTSSPYAGKMKRGRAVWLTMEGNEDYGVLDPLDTGLPLGYNYDYKRMAQGFVTPQWATGGFSVDLHLRRQGYPIGNLWVEIWIDNGGGLASGQPWYPYMESATRRIPAQTITDQGDWYTFHFTLPIPVGQYCYIVLRCDYPVSSSNYIMVQAKQNNPYVDGRVMMGNEMTGYWAAWSAQVDLGFRMASATSLFKGYIQDWQDSAVPREPLVRLYCVDYSRQLARKRISTALLKDQMGGQVVRAILAAAGYTRESIAVDDGTELIRYAGWHRAMALDAIREVEEAEQGLFYVDEAGLPHWEDRHRRWRWPNNGLTYHFNNAMEPGSVRVLRTEVLVNEAIVTANSPRVNAPGAVWTLGHRLVLAPNQLEEDLECEFGGLVSMEQAWRGTTGGVTTEHPLHYWPQYDQVFQPFVMPVNMSRGAFRLYLINHGGVIGSLYVQIWSDEHGKPGKLLWDQRDHYYQLDTWVMSAEQWDNWYFPFEYELRAGQTYQLVVTANYTWGSSTNKYVALGQHTVRDNLVAGRAGYSDTSASPLAWWQFGTAVYAWMQVMPMYWKANRAPNGTGLDMAAYERMAVSLTARGATLTIRNKAPHWLYFSELEISGQSIGGGSYTRRAVDTSGELGSMSQAVSISPALLTNPNSAQALADYRVALGRNAGSWLTLTITANRSKELMDAVRNIHLSSRVAVTQSHLSMTAQQYTVEAIEHSITHNGKLHRVTYTLAPAPMSTEHGDPFTIDSTPLGTTAVVWW